MHFRRFFEGVTGTIRSAAAGIVQRASGLLSGDGEHHRVRRAAIVGTAAAVFTVSGATAAWAISNTDGHVEATATETPAATTEAPATTAAPSPTEAPATIAAPTPTKAPVPEPEPEPAGPVDIDVSGLDDEQEANAVTIIEVGKERGFGENGWAVALATAMQESKLYNAASGAVPESMQYTDSAVTYSDHDSVGIFQQRPSMGWGSVEELMDVATSAGKFYGALAEVGGWEHLSIASAAQAVQVSAFPDAYAQWEGLAWDVIDAYQSAS